MRIPGPRLMCSLLRTLFKMASKISFHYSFDPSFFILSDHKDILLIRFHRYVRHVMSLFSGDRTPRRPGFQDAADQDAIITVVWIIKRITLPNCEDMIPGTDGLGFF